MSVNRGVLTIDGTTAEPGEPPRDHLVFSGDSSGLTLVSRNSTIVTAAGEDVGSDETFTGVHSVVVKFGEGHDILELQPLTLQRVTVFGNGGDDNISADGMTLTRLLKIDGGLGTDVIDIQNSSLASVQIDTGDSGDRVTLAGVTASGAVKITTGEGDDVVETPRGLGGTGNTFSRGFTVELGVGNDRASLGPGSYQDVSLRGAGGLDRLWLTQTEIAGAITLLGGAEGDEFLLTDVTQTSALTVTLDGQGGGASMAILNSELRGTVLANTGGAAGAAIDVDDSLFHGFVLFQLAGNGSRLNIEQNLDASGKTTFLGILLAMFGPNGQMNIGQYDNASYTEFRAPVIVLGGSPETEVCIAETRVEFASPPVLIQARRKTLPPPVEE